MPASSGSSFCTHGPSGAAGHDYRFLLDPCYHIVDPVRSLDDDEIPLPLPASPCASLLSSHSHSNETWTHSTGDPDFRPFATVHNHSQHRGHSHSSQSRRPSIGISHSAHPRQDSGSSLMSLPRRSFDLEPSPPPPSKAARSAARRQLDPSLRAAIRAHEREYKSHQRRPSWFRRHRTRSPSELDKENDVVIDDHMDDSLDFAPYSPPPLPDLVLDDDTEDDEDASEARPSSPTVHPLRHHIASISLRVDLAVFRAKKRLRRHVGLE